jgi:hypothetical protein
MKATTYAAEATHDTWSKQGYLFENGLFISIYSWFNKATYFCKFIGTNEFPERIGWGKGVMGAYTDYQFFTKGSTKEMDFEELKSKCTSLPWINSNLNGLNLKQENRYDIYHYTRIQEILSQTRSLGITDVQNTQNCKESDIKYLIVGDNPGINEVKLKMYFVGSSGQALKKQFESEGLVDDFYKECLIFNKTMLHSRQTSELEELRSQIGEALFNEILALSAKHIANVQRELKVPILVFGLSELKEGKLLFPFWSALMGETDVFQSLLLFRHPSHDHFRIQWSEEATKHPELNSKELLQYIGELNKSKHSN